MSEVKVRLPAFNVQPISSGGWFTPAWFQFFQGIYDRTGAATDLIAPSAAINGITTVGTIERLGTDSYTTYTVTTFAKTLLNDTNAPTMRVTLELGTAAIADIGTSGDTVPLLSGDNTWSGAQNFGDVTLGNVLATTSTSATAGAASALPATPAGYKEETINGVVRKIPYY